MPDRGPDAVRHAAHDILARPEFRPPYVSPVDRALRWLETQFAHVIAAAINGRLSVVGVLVLVAIVALFVWLIVRLVRNTRADRTVGLVVAAERRAPADWLAEAAACEARGDFRGALRARYRALVAELARRGLVDEVPGRTTGEYRREVGGSLPTSAGAFGGATDLFELAVYGGSAAGPSEASELSELSRRVLDAAR